MLGAVFDCNNSFLFDKLALLMRNISCVVKQQTRFFFTLVINQFDAQNLFYNKFISCLYMFRAPCAHRHTYRCDDTRGCIVQF